MNIHVHVERIVLDGLPVGFGARTVVQRSVETELGRMLAGRGLDPALLSGAALRSVAAPPIQLEHGASPSDLGRLIAGSLGSSITRERGVSGRFGGHFAGRPPRHSAGGRPT